MNPHNKNVKKEIKEEFEEQQTTNHFTGFIPEELVNNSKTLVIKGASMVAKSKSKKAIIMNPGNKFAKKEEHFEEEQTTQHFSGFIPEELVNNSKSLVIKGASMIAKSKQDLL